MDAIFRFIAGGWRYVQAPAKSATAVFLQFLNLRLPLLGAFLLTIGGLTMTEQENTKIPNIFLRLTALILGLLALMRICLTASLAYHPFLIVISSVTIVSLCILALRKSLPIPFWPKGGFSLLSQVSLAAAFILIVLGVSRNYIVNPEKVTASQEKVESTHEEAPEPIPVAEPEPIPILSSEEIQAQQEQNEAYQMQVNIGTLRDAVQDVITDIRGIEIQPSSAYKGKYIAIITITSDINSTKRIRLESAKAFQALYKTGLPLQTVKMIVYGPTQDPYGN